MRSDIHSLPIGVAHAQTACMTHPLDPVQAKEFEMRSAAYVGSVLSRDSRLHDASDPVRAFAERGFARFAPHVKAAVAAMTSTDEAIALAPLSSAFALQVDQRSLLGKLTGATEISLTAGIRLQTGILEANVLGETVLKPAGRLDFTLADGPPDKAVAQLVGTAEFFRTVDQKTQAGIQSTLASACARALDVRIVSLLTAGAALPSSDIGALFAAISGGAPANPFLIGGLDTLLPLADQIAGLQALGIAIVATPAAAGTLIALDAGAVLVADGGASVRTAAHASIALDVDAPTTLTSLWQANLLALLGERFFRFVFKADAVAFAVTGSPA